MRKPRKKSPQKICPTTETIMATQCYQINVSLTKQIRNNFAVPSFVPVHVCLPLISRQLSVNCNQIARSY